MVKNVDWCRNFMQSETRNIWGRREVDRCVAAVKQQCHFFLNNAIKGSIIWAVFPLCLGIMYCERRDPCITMGRGSIRCRSPSASWSKPHTSDSVYPASSAAIHFIDLHEEEKKKPAACQGLRILDCNANRETQALIVRDGVFASAHQGRKNPCDKQANICHPKHCCSQSLMWCYSAELLLALALSVSYLVSKASNEKKKKSAHWNASWL